ncbi:Fungal specific transcription factor domain [Nakaseomyces glabratus]
MVSNADETFVAPRLIRVAGGGDDDVHGSGSGAGPANGNSVSGSNTGSRGSTPTYRVAQACDRCRLKKTKCDGKIPQCSQCALVGFECKISDRLNRKSFPRGYTETLEERVRELETENKRLMALCNSDLGSNTRSDGLEKQSPSKRKRSPSMERDSERGFTENMELQLQQSCSSCGNSDPNHRCVHLKPVVSNIIVDSNTDVSFEQNVAPGLPAVKALNSMAEREESAQLAMLVSLALPRSTEEILFIPQLMANIQKTFGFSSKQSLYTVSLLSSLKKNLPTPNSNSSDENLSPNYYVSEDFRPFFYEVLKFDILGETETENGSNRNESPDSTIPNSRSDDLLSWMEIQRLVDVYFECWSNTIPIFSRKLFIKQMKAFKTEVDKFGDRLFEVYKTEQIKINFLKIFATVLAVMCQMALLSRLKQLEATTQELECKRTQNLIAHYNQLIEKIHLDSFFQDMSTTTVQSLQLLSFISFYFLNVGDIPRLYQLRGTVISMAQQLRLHRCPSAVLLSASGSTMQKFEQGERRLLFWAIYYLDVFYSLQLGVPRLIKDHEIECALPVSEEEDSQLEGRVSDFSLAVIRYAKVLGNILDSIFKRNMMSEAATESMAFVHEKALDIWKNRLPEKYGFRLEANGLFNFDELTVVKNSEKDLIEKSSILLFYFLAKCMIHLPVIATRSASLEQQLQPGTSSDTSETPKESQNKTPTRVCPSYILMQKAASTMLQVMHYTSEYYLPSPINISRTKARFALLTACSAVEYLKGGSLYVETKNLLENLIIKLELERKLDLPGIISWHSLKLLDMALMLLLQSPTTKMEKLDKLVQKKINHYNRQMGIPAMKLSNSRKNNKKIKLENESSQLSSTSNPIAKGELKSDSVVCEEDDNVNDNEVTTTAKLEENNEFINPNKIEQGVTSNTLAFSFSSTDLSALFNAPESLFKVPNENTQYNQQHEMHNNSISSSHSKEPVNKERDSDKQELNAIFNETQNRSTSFAKLMLLLNNEHKSLSSSLENDVRNVGNKLSSENAGQLPSHGATSGLNSKGNEFLSMNTLYGGDNDFIIDASLGLAPLLSENNEIHRQHEGTQVQAGNNDILSTRIGFNGKDDYSNSRSFTNEMFGGSDTKRTRSDTTSLLTANSELTHDSQDGNVNFGSTNSELHERLNNNHFDAATSYLPEQKSEYGSSFGNKNTVKSLSPSTSFLDDDTLSLSFGDYSTQRRPRRYPNYNNTLGKDSLAMKTEINGGRNQGNLHDLFQWQNSK